MPSEPGNRRAVGPIRRGMDPTIDPGSPETWMSLWLARVRAWLDARAIRIQPAYPSIALGHQQPRVALTMADARWQTSAGEPCATGETRTRDQEADVETLAIEDAAKEAP